MNESCYIYTYIYIYLKRSHSLYIYVCIEFMHGERYQFAYKKQIGEGRRYDLQALGFVRAVAVSAGARHGDKLINVEGT